jgi:hypothetical protein
MRYPLFFAASHSMINKLTRIAQHKKRIEDRSFLSIDVVSSVAVYGATSCQPGQRRIASKMVVFAFFESFLLFSPISLPG